MNQTKRNRRPWYMLGLALLLCTAAVILATGTARARYQAERKETLTFQVRSPAQICLGTLAEQSETEETGETQTGEQESEAESQEETTPVFDPEGQLSWKEVTEDELYTLDFAVANGDSEESFSSKAQRIRIRLITTGGVTDSTEFSLRIPAASEEEEPTDIPATATPIEAGTDLYTTNGYGYIYTFCEQTEETEEEAEAVEMSWVLPGGEFAYLPFTLVLKGSLPVQASLLQPQIQAELID